MAGPKNPTKILAVANKNTEKSQTKLKQKKNGRYVVWSKHWVLEVFLEVSTVLLREGCVV